MNASVDSENGCFFLCCCAQNIIHSRSCSLRRRSPTIPSSSLCQADGQTDRLGGWLTDCGIIKSNALSLTQFRGGPHIDTRERERESWMNSTLIHSPLAAITINKTASSTEIRFLPLCGRGT